MASSITKTLSFRVPIGTYNNLIKETKEKGVNMTELLCSKIINSEDLTVEKVGADTRYLEHKVISLERTLEEYSNRQQNSNIRIRTLESELEESNSQKSHFRSFVKKGNELEAELNSAKEDNDSLRTEIGLLEQNLEKIKQENLLIEAENKGLRFNDLEGLTSEVKTLKAKLIDSQEQTTYYKIEYESLKPRNSNLQVLLDAEKLISAERAQEIRSYINDTYRLEEKLEDAKNENTRQKEENQKLNEEIQALKERVKQIDGLNKHIKELQGEIITVQEGSKEILLLYNGVDKMYSEEEKKVQTMREKHNVVIREIVHKLSHTPESFKDKGEFKFIEGEIWE